MLQILGLSIEQNTLAAMDTRKLDPIVNVSMQKFFLLRMKVRTYHSISAICRNCNHPWTCESPGVCVCSDVTGVACSDGEL